MATRHQSVTSVEAEAEGAGVGSDCFGGISPWATPVALPKSADDGGGPTPGVRDSANTMRDDVEGGQACDGVGDSRAQVAAECGGCGRAGYNLNAHRGGAAAGCVSYRTRGERLGRRANSATGSALPLRRVRRHDAVQSGSRSFLVLDR